LNFMRHVSKTFPSCRTILMLLSIKGSERCAFIKGGYISNLRNREVRNRVKRGMSVYMCVCFTEPLVDLLRAKESFFLFHWPPHYNNFTELFCKMVLRRSC
jgi:hypothetical protein